MSEVRYFKKQPVTIEAMKFETNNEPGNVNMATIVNWVNDSSKRLLAWQDGTNIFVKTLEGEMRADVGDWIIKGVKGEFYPVKPDIFKATYNEVFVEPAKEKPYACKTVRKSDCTEVTVVEDSADDTAGAVHDYEVMRVGGNPLVPAMLAEIRFQRGPIKENGINGVQNEDLIAIIIDRLQHFQKGPFACRENAIALTHLETAQLWLDKRTDERKARGVEGTNKK